MYFTAVKLVNGIRLEKGFYGSLTQISLMNFMRSINGLSQFDKLKVMNQLPVGLRHIDLIICRMTYRKGWSNFNFRLAISDNFYVNSSKTFKWRSFRTVWYLAGWQTGSNGWISTSAWPFWTIFVKCSSEAVLGLLTFSQFDKPEVKIQLPVSHSVLFSCKI